jgi:hypothetical protein
MTEILDNGFSSQDLTATGQLTTTKRLLYDRLSQNWGISSSLPGYIEIFVLERSVLIRSTVVTL